MTFERWLGERGLLPPIRYQRCAFYAALDARLHLFALLDSLTPLAEATRRQLLARANA